MFTRTQIQFFFGSDEDSKKLIPIFMFAWWMTGRTAGRMNPDY